MVRPGLFAAIFIFTPTWNLGAQTLKEQAQAALAAQCIATTGNPPVLAQQAKDCLDALYLYIVSPANSDLALKRLNEDQPLKDVQETYTLAASQFKGSFWDDLVAKATKPQYVKADGSDARDADDMFASADATITDLYKDKTDNRPALAKVGADSDAKNYLRALYDLQSATTDPKVRQLFRACYAEDLNRLFKLVNKHFNK
jgi:hypothetical protein